MRKLDQHAGLAFHLQALHAGTLRRRDIMRWAVGTGLVSLVGCGDDAGNAIGGSGGNDGSAANGGSGDKSYAADGGGSCQQIPEETEGPYPADGSNTASSSGMPGGGAPPGSMGGPGAANTGGSASGDIINALTLAGIMRRDIRSSVGASTTTAEGIPLTLELSLVDVDHDCKPLAGAAVYIWHCDRSGNYSLYAQSISNENYLRGVQVTDANGKVTFDTIFPACYSGRWPHIHYEVYPSLDKATVYSNKRATSQIAMPEDKANEVFATDGYETSVTNFKMVSLESDMVFSDSYAVELPEITGNVSDGYVISFSAAVKGS